MNASHMQLMRLSLGRSRILSRFPTFVTEAIKVKYPVITYADLYQVTSIDLCDDFGYQGLLHCLLDHSLV